jgi:hypothetical protein
VRLESNLSPEPASPKPGYHGKDRLENRLHGGVCFRDRGLRGDAACDRSQLAAALPASPPGGRCSTHPLQPDFSILNPFTLDHMGALFRDRGLNAPVQ